MSDISDIRQWLVAFVEQNGGVAGTVHTIDGDSLTLCATHNIPEPVIAKTRTIPKGKGMAGLAWQRGTPVQTCNLKTDETGDVRAGAKAVNANAAVAIPLGDPVRAVAGIAFAGERSIEAEELHRLGLEAAAALRWL